MRLSISNLAWNVAEDATVAVLLRRYRIDGIEVVPSKYFQLGSGADAADILRVRRWWMDRGVEITGMQALLFGTRGLNLFGEDDSRAAMLHHMAEVCRIASGLGAKYLVFGSPKNRDRTGLTNAQAEEIAVAFFRRLGDVASAQGAVICLEPNPPCYGCNFMTGTADTARVVRAVAHPSVRMQYDTGAIAINREDPHTILEHHADIIGHIHASEPALAPLGDGGADHETHAAVLSKAFPDRLVAIEMRAPFSEGNLSAIERALGVADRYYRRHAAAG